MLVRRDVREMLRDHFVVAKLWTDKPAPVGPANTKLRNGFRSNALPLYVLQAPDGRILEKIEGKILSGDAFLATLTRARAAAPGAPAPPG